MSEPKPSSQRQCAVHPEQIVPWGRPCPRCTEPKPDDLFARPHAATCYVFINARALIGVDRRGLCTCGAESGVALNSVTHPNGAPTVKHDICPRTLEPAGPEVVASIVRTLAREYEPHVTCHCARDEFRKPMASGHDAECPIDQIVRYELAKAGCV